MMRKSDTAAFCNLMARLVSYCADAPTGKGLEQHNKEIFSELRKRADVADVEEAVVTMTARGDAKWPEADTLVVAVLQARKRRLGDLEEQDRKAREAQEAEAFVVDLAAVPSEPYLQEHYLDQAENPADRVARIARVAAKNERLGRGGPINVKQFVDDISDAVDAHAAAAAKRRENR